MRSEYEANEALAATAARLQPETRRVLRRAHSEALKAAQRAQARRDVWESVKWVAPLALLLLPMFIGR